MPISGIPAAFSGTVADVHVLCEDHADPAGMRLQFSTSPGDLSRMAESSIEQAMPRMARALGASTGSWFVTSSAPSPGVTIDSDNLSAVVALSTMVSPQGQAVGAGLAMTEPVASESDIGPVEWLTVKLVAAERVHIQTVRISSMSAEMSDGLQPSLPVRIVPATSAMKDFNHS